MTIKLLFKKPEPYYTTAQELALEIDYLLFDARRKNEVVEGITISGQELAAMRYANLLIHDGAFMTYRGIKIWT